MRERERENVVANFQLKYLLPRERGRETQGKHKSFRKDRTRERERKIERNERMNN